jgi:alcohol dehydrogenase class IV
MAAFPMPAIAPFRLSRTPAVRFGPGSFQRLPEIVLEFGRSALIVTGKGSFSRAGRWEEAASSLKALGIRFERVGVCGEPSPEWVDMIAQEFRGKGVELVAAIGGGSALDAGKAVSAMLPQSGRTEDFLEDVGVREHDGRKVPFIAVPTTCGTGSEATANAVLSRVGPGGFKKSLRHERLVPEAALIDPELALLCPPGVSAACGFDAFVQLLEAYTSPLAPPFVSDLALGAIARMKDAFLPSCGTAGRDIAPRSDMAYAAFASGLCLANAGAGIVHGIAGPAGGFHPIPHGALCAALAAPAVEMNIRALTARGRPEDLGLEKYARVGALLSGHGHGDGALHRQFLVETLRSWTKALHIPSLADYGIRETDIDRIVDAARNKNNPIALTKEEIRKLLLSP